jgi:hypothetical protein
MDHQWPVGQVLSNPPYPLLEVVEHVEDGYIVKLFHGPDAFRDDQENRYHSSKFQDAWLVSWRASSARKPIFGGRRPETPEEVLRSVAHVRDRPEGIER